MATAAQVIKAALQRILVQASEQALSPDEYNDAIFALNNMMLAYDAQGIELGFTEINNLGDQVTVPTGALRGLIANLAIEVSPDYNGQITPALITAASEGLKAMRQLGVSEPQSYYPSTLPIGTGNMCDSGYRQPRFYPALEAEILAETTGSIALETGTEAAANE